MMLAIEYASWAFILLGSFFTVVGALGIVRMPEIFTRMHAASVTDTLGYRTGDQLGAWSYHGLQGLGLSLNAISWIAVPLTAAWCALSIWLARKQRLLADAQAKRNQCSPLTDIPAAEPA